MTAASLVKVDLQGNLVSGDYAPNLAGHLIHSAVLAARPDINFAAHTHSRAGGGGQRHDMRPVTAQPALQHHPCPRVCYHDYLDVTQEADECAALARDLANNHLMIMRNHGLLSVGGVR